MGCTETAASSWTSTVTGDGIANLLDSPGPIGTTPPEASQGALTTGPEVQDIQSAIRFSATPDWVMQNWSRISIIEVDGMRGMRVPFVSGLQLHDVAGSLTYCFDDSNQLQRISFRGVTGDPRKMQQIATTGYDLKNEGAQGGLYVARWNGKPTSFMLVEAAPVIRADSPNSRYRVRMELNRPRSYLTVSQEMQQLVAARTKNDASWRW